MSEDKVGKDNLTVKSYFCNVCSKSYAYKHTFQRHYYSIHGNNDGFKCIQCNKCFKRNDVMKKHMKNCIKKMKATETTETTPTQNLPQLPENKQPSSPSSTPLQLSENLRHASSSQNPTEFEEVPLTREQSLKESDESETKSSNLIDEGMDHSRGVNCRLCGLHFGDRRSLIHHRVTSHLTGKGDKIWLNDNAPWIKDNGDIDLQLKETYEMNILLIKESQDKKVLSAYYNFPISNDFTIEELMVFVNKIYNLQTETFRLNLVFGYILWNVETKKYRYFKPYNNTEIFNFPFCISKRRDLEKFEEKLKEIDICSYVMKDRPSTKWKFFAVTNVKFFLYYSGFMLGAPVNLPNYITKQNNGIISFEKDIKHSKTYQDNLCLFRCLAFHDTNSFANAFETRVKHKFAVWCEYMYKKKCIDVKNIDIKDFQGVSLNEISNVEECFNVNIDVFEIDEKEITKVVYKSPALFNSHMYLNIFENHLSYITNLNRYAKKYMCSLCKKHFKTCKKLHRHEKNCSIKTIHVFPGRFYEKKKTIFDELREIDIIVQTSDEYFPWFIVFDFEAILKKVNESSVTSKLQIERIHQPISVSICSNVPDFENERFILNETTEELLQEMVLYMEKINTKVYELAKEKWCDVFKKLNSLVEYWKPNDHQDLKQSSDLQTDAMDTLECEPPSKLFLKKLEKKNIYQEFQKNLLKDTWTINYNEHSSDSECLSEIDCENESESDCEIETNETNRVKIIMHNHVKRVLSNFTNYCLQVPVLGFNSSKYDLNLVKNKLAKILGMHDQNQTFVIKRNNSYTCIATPKFRFLDMNQYLAAGTSYSKFLKAYGVEEEKGFFPYEWFDSTDKLDDTKLPPMGDDWFSSLKQKSVLDDGKQSPLENYKFLESIWKYHDMKTFRDFLQWYNNLDVKPFVKGVLNYCKMYWEKNIDVFKVAFSIPGLARLNLFNASEKKHAVFPLFDFSTKDIYRTIQDNIVGGPSIIFTRYHESGKTFLRGNFEKPCKRIVGYDANALYLHCIGQNMPVGYFIIRRECDGFKAEKMSKYWNMFIWMDWVSGSKNCKILHKLNNNHEKRVGPFPVDGYDPITKTIYQYNGCYFHGHSCHLNQRMNSNEREKRFNKTKDCEMYLTKQGYKVQSIWECEFFQLLRKNKTLQAVADQNCPSFYKKYKNKVTMKQILKAIQIDELFGMVECDIHVPLEWMKIKPNTTLSPFDYFKEMSPIFCTSEVPFSAIGDHMQSYAKEMGLSENSKTLLISGNKATKIMLATPLLKWYLEHGLIVTRIYTVVESASMDCFSEFTKNISETRRRGDCDKSLTVISDTAKVEGNSAYGSLLLNKDKFVNIKFIEGVENASKKVNDRLFVKLTELDSESNYYEIQMAKKKIVHNMPIQLGFFVLQYAKLRMLQFYYDFLDQYIDRSDFEYMEMDTDSAYFAISGDSLDDIIKPEFRDKYLQSGFFNCTDNVVYNDSNFWLPRKCCDPHSIYDKKTPGLFKLEFEGDVMVGLCSKTYAIKNSNENKEKFSSKGIAKQSVKNAVETYKRVLDTKQSESGLNRGFLLRENNIFSYNQMRTGITYFYCKRKVLDDGIHTDALDITLTPCKKLKLDN